MSANHSVDGHAQSEPSPLERTYRNILKEDWSDSDYFLDNIKAAPAYRQGRLRMILSKMMHRPHYYRMHGKSRNFVGIRRADRKARKKEVIAAIAKNSSQKWHSLEEFCADTFSRPVSSETTGKDV